MEFEWQLRTRRERGDSARHAFSGTAGNER